MTHNHQTAAPSRISTAKMPLLAAAVVVIFATLYLSPTAMADKATAIPAPDAQVVAAAPGVLPAEDRIVVAGGCFWGIQAVFQHTRGVLNAVSGYAGGTASGADYETVSSGGTGHAESVEITFDPKQVSYAELLHIYFSVAHDPTQLNRQYPDSGTQYRSAIFYHDPDQKRVAQRYIAQLDAAKVFARPIVTQISRLDHFYPAERYHQNYATLHPDAGYIAHYDLPKLDNLKTLFPALYREQPVLVAP